MNFQAKCTSLYTNQRVSKYASGLSACPTAEFRHTNSLIRRWTTAACAVTIILPNSSSRHYTTTDSPTTTLQCPNYCNKCPSVPHNRKELMFSTTMRSLKKNINYSPVPWNSYGKIMERMEERWKDKSQLDRKENPFIRQLKIIYFTMYATILNTKAAKPTEHGAKVNENQPKSHKIIITTQDKYECK